MPKASARRPLLQVALDMPDLRHALEVAGRVSSLADVIEAGTLLCVAEGGRAVRELKRAHPGLEVVADLRICRAGAAIAKLAFDAGADTVTCVAEAPAETVRAAARAAADAGRSVELELDENWDLGGAEMWRDCGIGAVTCHMGTEVSSLDGEDWGKQALGKVAEAAESGFAVTVAGGITPGNASAFRGLPVAKVVCGKSVWSSSDSLGKLADIADALSG